MRRTTCTAPATTTLRSSSTRSPSSTPWCGGRSHAPIHPSIHPSHFTSRMHKGQPTSCHVQSPGAAGRGRTRVGGGGAWPSRRLMQGGAACCGGALVGARPRILRRPPPPRAVASPSPAAPALPPCRPTRRPSRQIETADSSVLAQMGWPDMRLPILYTMSWPERVLCSEQVRSGGWLAERRRSGAPASAQSVLAHLGRPRRAAAPAKLPHPLHTHPPPPFLQTWPRLDFIKMGDLTFRWAPPLLRRRRYRRVGRGATDRRHTEHVGAFPPLSIQLRLQRASFVGTPAGSHVVHSPGPPLGPACTHARRQPDHAKYPSMKVAYAAGRAGGTMTGVMSAANEQVGAGVGARGKWVNAALQGASARRARNAAWSQEPEVLVRPATCHDAPPRGLPALLLLTRPPAPPHPNL